MTVKATITKKDGSLDQRDFRSYLDLAAWLEHEYGEYTAVDARQVSASEIRQGRNSA